MALVIRIVEIVAVLTLFGWSVGRLAENPRESARRQAARDLRRDQRAAWGVASRENEALLRDLQRRLSGQRVKLFGSSVHQGKLVYERRYWGQRHWPNRSHFDLDLMVEVDLATWRRWALTAYHGGRPVGVAVDQFVRAYELSSPTCDARLAAAIEVGLDLTGVKVGRLDVFLFPHEFVRGQMNIPAWNDPKRSFRREVLAGLDLETAKAGRVSLQEYIS